MKRSVRAMAVGVLMVAPALAGWRQVPAPPWQAPSDARLLNSYRSDVPWLTGQRGRPPTTTSRGNCSAFVATGDRSRHRPEDGRGRGLPRDLKSQPWTRHASGSEGQP